MSTAAELHQRLIDQLASRGLLDDRRRRAAFQAVRREHFLPDVDLDRGYRDEAVTIQVGPGGTVTSSSSQPSIMAMMLAQLDPQPGDHVLEVGAGTGYNAALLAYLVGPGGEVTTIDIDPAITRTAQANLAMASVDQVNATHLALLGELLAGKPTLEPAPPLPKGMGWFARLALDEPGAIQLFDPEQDRLRLGLFDPSAANPGLALVLDGGERLAGFGNGASMARLRDHLTHSTPLDFRALRIEAVPAGIAALRRAPDDTTWVLIRPTHEFWIGGR
jgi:Protein-L-isoaspartate(D-aspartate) O-methyltransferase (PCMT)